MVLMAIDHVRVYSGVPAGGPTARNIITPWVTQFSAPAFGFLAGTAAFLHGRKAGDTRVLSRYLLTRGLLLVVLELTVIRLCWTFSVGRPEFLLAGVIWMLGWCMVLMALLVRLPAWVVGTVGLAVIFGQDAFGPLSAALPSRLHWLAQFIYLGGEVPVGGASMTVLYTIVPWIGVMAAGYGFGALMTRERAERRRLCLRIGVAATLLFVVAAGAVAAFGPAGGDAPPLLFRILNQRKYPASQLFLLMTLGPGIALLPLAERARGRVAAFFTTFGRVPMFYYLLHIPVIHALALVAWLIRDGQTHAAWFMTAPYVSVPEPERWGLALLYLVFALSILALFGPCRWYAAAKARGSSPWMKYV
jgi:uncharacterized membrane protein